MLKITIPETEFYDQKTNTFYNIKETTLQLEHSLVSLAKWESKWHIPFLGKSEKTTDMFLDYVRCMTITQNVNPLTYYGLTSDNIEAIKAYIDDPMTATWFSNKNKRKGNPGKAITAEIIYYWMVALEIPIECEKWHLNRLLTLIKVCNIKNQPSKKMSKRDIYNQNRMLNEARKAKYHTRG